MADRSDYLLDQCPNCTQRRADTLIDYYEVINFSYSTSAFTRRRRGVSWRKTWVSGKTRICAQCASLYTRSVAYRRIGRRLVNWGAGIMVVGGILYLIFYSNVAALSHGLGALVSVLPALLGLLCLIFGLVLLAMGTLLKRRGTHFLEKRLK